MAGSFPAPIPRGPRTMGGQAATQGTPTPHPLTTLRYVFQCYYSSPGVCSHSTPEARGGQSLPAARLPACRLVPVGSPPCLSDSSLRPCEPVRQRSQRPPTHEPLSMLSLVNTTEKSPRPVNRCRRSPRERFILPARLPGVGFRVRLAD
ncbi:hypothetical protein BC834DRAFT_406994 [Gloeopeniophorella convolvens]|nr:hypothetical protein BC834DRAFT_406994 [Gloeopeniophorella convolvens]